MVRFTLAYNTSNKIEYPSQALNVKRKQNVGYMHYVKMYINKIIYRAIKHAEKH